MAGDDSRDTSRRAARGGVAAFACLLALLALIVAAACAWRVWQWNGAQASQAAAQNARLDAAEREAAAAGAGQQALQRQLEDVQGDLRALRDAQAAFDQRARNLETAFGQLSTRQFQGRDALLLDDAEFLLRAGQQRWVLFHDPGSAARAYALAEDALAQVSDPAFAPVRNGIANERAALLAAAAPARAQALDELAALRGQAADLPLRGTEHASPGDRNDGWPRRVWRALSGVLRVQREDRAPVTAADARIAHELLALDLAQAQVALLAFDDAGFRESARRAAGLLAARFDLDAAEVRSVQSRVRALLTARMSAPAPQLGGALAQLRALRAAHAVQTIAPAPAVSAGKP